MPNEVQVSVFTYLTCSSDQLEEAENKPAEKSSVVPPVGRDSQVRTDSNLSPTSFPENVSDVP